MKRTRTIILLTLLLSAAGAILAGARPASDAETRACKARYYYLEGARLQAESRHGEAYEMFRHALRIRPDYPEAAMEVAQIRLALENDTLQTPTETQRSLKMMQDFVDRYPAEYFESQYYGYLATQYDNLAEARRVYTRTDSIYPERTANLLKLAEVCMAMRDKDATFDALDTYERREGRSDYLSRTKVLYYLVFADTVGALRESTLQCEANPTSTAALALKGKVFEIMNLPDSARRVYEAAERLHPDNGGIKFELARFYLALGDSAVYEHKIEEALLCEDLDVEQKVAVLGDFMRAVDIKADSARIDRLYDALALQYPHEPRVLQLSAAYHFASDKVEKAIEDIDYAIDLDPANEEYYAQKLMFDAYAERYSDALATYHRAEKVLDPSWKLMELAGQCAALVPDTTEAFRIYDDMLGLIDDNLSVSDSTVSDQTLRSLNLAAAEAVSQIFCSLGDMLHLAADTTASYRKYDIAIRVNPMNPLALNNYAYFLAVDGHRLEEALEMSEKALELAPDSKTYLDTFAYILFRLGRPEEAIEYQLQALNDIDENDKDNAEFLEHLGDIYSALGETDKALEYWEKADTADPGDPLLRKKIEQKRYIAPEE